MPYRFDQIIEMNKEITECQLTINRRKDDEIRELDQMKTMFEKPLIKLMENKLDNNNNNANQNEIILMNNKVLTPPPSNELSYKHTSSIKTTTFEFR
jgi:hypothetical protein